MTNESSLPTNVGSMERLGITAALLPGWYWVRFERCNETFTMPMPAQWDGRHWDSVNWSCISPESVAVLERITSPGIDPLQGAADWLCKTCDEPDVALIQKQLLLGYNRAARLFAKAMPASGGNFANAVQAAAGGITQTAIE